MRYCKQVIFNPARNFALPGFEKVVVIEIILTTLCLIRIIAYSYQ